MSRSYPPEVHAFIREHVAGRSCEELVNMTNAAFGTSFTKKSMSSYKKNHHLKSGMPTSYPGMRESKVFPREIAEYIISNHKGIGPTEMSHLVNDTFGTQYTVKQLDSYYNNHKLNSGLTGHFEKGQVSPNKGKKGIYIPGSEKGYFKKGNTPFNKQPVGTVVTKHGGYLWKKIGEGCREWKQLHLIIWEEAHGLVPKGHVVIFKDGNRQNCTLENLMMITRGEAAVMNHNGLRFSTPEHTETGLLIAKVKIAAKSKGRGKHGDSENR